MTLDPGRRSDSPVTYAIGDIHGRLDLLDRLIEAVETDASTRNAAAKIVFTGDYLDRGADSHGVVERLMAGPRRAGDTFVCLRGNHDDLFVKAVTGGHDIPDWAQELHRHTFVSYGRTPDRNPAAEDMMVRHAAFLAALPLTHDDGTNLFVHAGIRPGVALGQQTERDLLWIREEFLSYPSPLPRRIVHGHTIMGDKPVMTINRVSIDTGAYRSGILTAAVFDGGDVTFLQAIGEPDRAAVVREILLGALIDGRTVDPAAQGVLDDFVAGEIDADGMALRLKGSGLV